MQDLMDNQIKYLGIYLDKYLNGHYKVAVRIKWLVVTEEIRMRNRQVLQLFQVFAIKIKISVNDVMPINDIYLSKNIRPLRSACVG